MSVQKTTSVVMFEEKKTISEKRTVVIFGVTRGGTSMVAGAVRAFGVSLGERLAVNNEDPDFTYKPMAHMKACVQARNQKFDCWGWKFPMAGNYLEELVPVLTNPFFIIVCRDIAATAGALTRWHNREISAALSEALLQTQKNFHLALRWQVPAMFVSYERAVDSPEQFLDELSAFLGMQLVASKTRLLEFMARGSYKSYDDTVSTS